MSRVNYKTYVKKVQHRVNALIARQNKALEEDDLWLGRFYIRQLYRNVYRFEDGSGAVINFFFEMADKKTGIRDICRLDNFELGIQCKKNNGRCWKLCEALNNFIVKRVNVWAEDPTPSLKTAVDYRAASKLPPMKLKELEKYSY